jgi:hypothetical protein
MKFMYAGYKYEIIGQCNGKAVVYSVNGEFACTLPQDGLDATFRSGKSVVYGGEGQ